MEQVDDLDGAGEQLVGNVPDPWRAVAEHHPAAGAVEAAPAGLAVDALGERRQFDGVVPGRGALDGGGVADRARFALGQFAARGVRRGRPDRDQLHFPGTRRAVGLLAGAAGEFRPAHRPAGTVHAQIHRRRPARLGLDHVVFVGRDLAAERLRGALRLLGVDVHPRQVVEQRAGLRKARPSRRQTGHADHAGRQRGTLDAEGAVARVEAGAAVRAVVVRPLEVQRTEHRRHLLAPSARASRAAAAAVARQPRPRAVTVVGVQPPLHQPRRQIQRPPPHHRLQRLEVDPDRRAVAEQRVDLGRDVRREGVRQRTAEPPF